MQLLPHHGVLLLKPLKEDMPCERFRSITLIFRRKGARSFLERAIHVNFRGHAPFGWSRPHAIVRD
jgi:hypothetical protein